MLTKFLLAFVIFFGGALSLSAQNGKWGQDSAKAVRQYSLYQEYHKQKNYKDAYKPWSWCFRNAPRASENLYIDGSDILKYKIKNAQPELKDAYVDTLEMMYDQRIELFADAKQKRGELLGRKAVDIYRAKPNEYQKVNEILKKSLELTGSNTIISVPYVYAITNKQLFKADKLEKSALIERYDRISQIMEENAQGGGRYASTWEKYKGKVDDLMAPYLSCEDLISVYQPQFPDKKEDVEALKSIQSKLISSNCTKTDFYFSVSEALFAQEPSASGAAGLGRGYLARDNLSEAAKYLRKAVELEKYEDRKAEHYLALAKAYKGMKQYSQAKSAAYSAARLKSNWGAPYIFLGDLYVQGASKCGDSFKQKAVYWAAIDKYNQAKANDPSFKDEANRRISTYKEYFPSKEETFFHNLSEGAEYQVDCWINETTTVRISS